MKPGHGRVDHLLYVDPKAAGVSRQRLSTDSPEGLAAVGEVV